MKSPRLIGAALVGVALVATGCSSSGSSLGHADPGAALSSALSSALKGIPAGGASLPSAGQASAPAQSLSKMSMRVVNLFDPKAVAGPALDIYDVQLNGQQATPVATNVAYGSASAYFTPHVPANAFGQPTVELFALPAGEDPVADKADAQGIGGAEDDGSHPQITWVLTADTGSAFGTGPLAGLSFSSRIEKGDSNGDKSPVAPPAPSGQGEILVDTSALSSANGALYLMIDDSCTPPTNGDSNMPGVPYLSTGAIDGNSTSFSIFPTAPGTHQVSVVSWTQSTTPTCAQLTARQGATSIDVTAGQQVETYVYGTSLTDLHLAVAPLTQ
jgi:hypothetical protein